MIMEDFPNQKTADRARTADADTATQDATNERAPQPKDSRRADTADGKQKQIGAEEA